MTAQGEEDQSQRIGPYRIVRKLGQGGMGIVHLAQDAQFRLVAVKVLRPELADDEGFRRRFAREAQAARQVARFCTAPVLDAGIDGKVAYLVTEYVDGPDLSEVVAAHGSMEGANLEALAVGVATALAAIHQVGVVHRDLKPSNILLSAVGPRVIDFGIARIVEPDATQSAVISGTPAYMAPEQANGGILTSAGDIFAWGCVVTYAGIGRPPFGTGPIPQVLLRIAHHEPVLDGLDERLRPLVARALRKDPADRPSAQQLLDHLLGRERATTIAATRAVSDAWTPLVAPDEPPPSPPRPPRRWVRPAIATAVAVAITAGVWTAVFRPWQQSPATASPATTTTAIATTTITGPAVASTPDATGAGTPGTQKTGRLFIHTNARGEQVRGHLQIDSLAWQGDNVMLRYTVRNDDAQATINLYHLIEQGGMTTDGIELILPDQPFPFTPMIEDGRCACSVWPPDAFLYAGKSTRGYAAFRRVPRSAKIVDLDLKDVGLFKNVVITR